MLLMGDEMRRSQSGNNNAYCHDNEINWLDWNLLQRHPDIHRFAKMLIAFRSRRDVTTENARLTLNQFLRQAQLEWHGTSLNHPDWSDDSHSIAFTAKSLRERFSIHAMLNAYWEPLRFELPTAGAKRTRNWRRWIDTSLASPDDICAWEDAPTVSGSSYFVEARSLVLLVEVN
jgi:isoamylase